MGKKHADYKTIKTRLERVKSTNLVNSSTLSMRSSLTIFNAFLPTENHTKVLLFKTRQMFAKDRCIL